MKKKIIFQKVCIIIPALNEEAKIGRVMQAITKVLKNVPEIKSFNIIVIDDGSVDRTSEIVLKNKGVLIKNKKNKGYSMSLNKGFKKALKIGGDLFITFDADGQHNPQNLKKVIKIISDSNVDVVVGNRPHTQRITETLLAVYGRYRINVNDPLTGFKAYKKKVYTKIGYFDSLESIGLDFLFSAYVQGFNIVQTNIDLNKREDNPRFGRTITANFKIFRALVKLVKKFRFK